MEEPTAERGGEPGLPAELAGQLAEQAVHLVAECGLVAEVAPGGGDHRRVLRAERPRLPFDAVADAGVGVVAVASPAGEGSLGDPHDARAVLLEVAGEGPDHQLALAARGQRGVAVVEHGLAVDVGRVDLGVGPHAAGGGELGVQGRAGDRRVEHELVEVRPVPRRVVDDAVDVLRRMFLQADDARPQHADPVALEAADQLEGVDPGELLVRAFLALQAHPDPRHADADQLVRRVLPQGVGRAEDVEGPGFAVALHQLQQAQGAGAMEQEVLVHDEERSDAHAGRELVHDVEQLVAGLVEVHEPALAAEHGGRRAEVAAQRAADGRDHGGGGILGPALDGDPHAARAEARGDQRVAQGLADAVVEEPSEPDDAVAADDVVGVDAVGQVRHVGDVAADHDGRVRQVTPHHLAHGPDLALVQDDAADADDVVVVLADLLLEALPGGEVEDGAGGRQVGLDQHQPPTAVEHAERERPLHPRHLVVVQLHRVEGSTAVFVVLRIRAADAGQQDPGFSAPGMDGGSGVRTMDLGVQQAHRRAPSSDRARRRGPWSRACARSAGLRRGDPVREPAMRLGRRIGDGGREAPGPDPLQIRRRGG